MAKASLHTTTEAAPASPTPSEPAVIKVLREKLGKAKCGPNGFVHVAGKGLIEMTLSRDNTERALQGLTVLLNQAEAQGYKLDRSTEVARLTLAGELVGFSLQEKTARRAHTPTSAELAKRDENRKWGYGSMTPWPKYDHHPSGQLAIVLQTATWSVLRKIFGETKARALGDISADVLAAVAGHIALLADNRRKAKESRRQAAIAQARRDRLKAFAEREARRGKFVDAVAKALAEQTR